MNKTELRETILSNIDINCEVLKISVMLDAPGARDLLDELLNLG